MQFLRYVSNHRAPRTEIIDGNIYDTATASKLAEAARRDDEDFTSILYRTPDGLFFVEHEMYNYDGFERIGGLIIDPLTAEEALEWLGQRAGMPIKIYQMEPPGPYPASYHDEVLKWLRGEPNEIGPRTVGEGWAKIAKDLVTKDPELLKSSYRLRKAIGAVVEQERMKAVAEANDEAFRRAQRRRDAELDPVKCGLYDKD